MTFVLAREPEDLLDNNVPIVDISWVGFQNGILELVKAFSLKLYTIQIN